MKFVMVNGPSCSGKTTVIERILNHKENFYRLSYDAQKWFFSKYDRFAHYQDVEHLVLAQAEEVCKMGYNIASDSGIHKDFRDRLLAIPAKYGYEIIEINLESEYLKLLERFRNRVAEAEKNPEIKISNKSEERFRELYEDYKAEKNPTARTFRTDSDNIDPVWDSILALI